MYTTVNFKSKKDLKTAVATGRKIGIYNPGLGGDPPANGEVAVEGPHYPKPHTWYGRATIKDGYIIKVV